MTTIAFIAGFVGAGLMILGLAIGAAANKISPLNEYISRLGRTGFKQRGLVNFCLTIGGLCFGLLLLGVGLRFENAWFSGFFAVFAVVTGIFGALVGLYPAGFPSEDKSPHFLFASVFFGFCLLLMFMFATYILGGESAVYPDSLAILAIPPIITGGIMIGASVVMSRKEDVKWSAADYGGSGAPKFMINPAMEWATVILLNVWVIAVSLHLLGG